MKPEFAVGIIGAGAVVRERHLPALAAQPGARVAWIADPLPQQREQAAALYGTHVRTVEEPGELLGDTDIVLVATPPAAHAARVGEALEAGCHVLCEKPLALDPGDCRRIIEAALEAGRVASVAFNLRHHPAAQALRAAVREGRLGRPVTLRSSSVSPEREGTTGWLGKGAAGGDALWEIGSHHADLWRFVLGGEIVEATGTVAENVAVLTARTSDST
ncbi:MAG: Gfo/Idh/MocA family oxidoreductase, partial [Solirubrobacteraceae bacterium]